MWLLSQICYIDLIALYIVRISIVTNFFFKLHFVKNTLIVTVLRILYSSFSRNLINIFSCSLFFNRCYWIRSEVTLDITTLVCLHWIFMLFLYICFLLCCCYHLWTTIWIWFVNEMVTELVVWFLGRFLLDFPIRCKYNIYR